MINANPTSLKSKHIVAPQNKNQVEMRKPLTNVNSYVNDHTPT